MTDNKRRQEAINAEYQKKFNADKKLQQHLGIVYTPVEVVDFIIHSVEDALRQEFGVGLTDEGVQILDPFTGTGAFITRLLQSGFIEPEDMERKYLNEIEAFEIEPTSFEVAKENIETVYQELTGASLPFPGIRLVDTFTLSADD